jgi:hypothetical protein
MTRWSSAKARRVLAALLQIGWTINVNLVLTKFLLAPVGLMSSFHSMTTTKSALKCWRAWQNIPACNLRICDVLFAAWPNKSLDVSPDESGCFAS